MGTGKTRFAVERDVQLRAAEYNGPTLVIAPVNTHDSWRETYQEFAPQLRVKNIDRKNRERFIKFQDKYEGPADVYIAHYEVLRLMPELVGRFGHGIFDECHRLQNRRAAQTKAAKKLRIPFLTDMSGSPITTKPENVWSILNHLKPNSYSAYWRFYEEMVDYKLVKPNNYRKSLGPSPAWAAWGLPAILDFYDRVLKDDVLDLPPIYESKIYVDLSESERRQYEEMRKTSMAWVNRVDWNYTATDDDVIVAPAVIAQLQRLQMFALGTAVLNPQNKVVLSESSAKCDALEEILEDNPNEQLVVFSQYKGPLKLLKRRFKAKGITFGSFTGDDPEKFRARDKAAFIRGDARVLLATIGSGGVGVDGLQRACCTAVMMDRHWSPTINDQAISRLHRGGQTRSVHVIDIIARNTIDQERLDKIALTRRWIKSMLGDKT